MNLFTAKAQRTQRFNYFLFSGERLRLNGREDQLVPIRTISRSPENKKNQLYKVNLIARGNYNCNIYKTPIIFSNSALSFFAALSTAKNKEKHLCVLRVSAVKTI
ncbi:MAG: hypothetical protein AB1Z29_15130 [Desulfobacterales bacterium]